ncbi:MAG TPA: histidine phosphatase family protein [Acidimicrobiales bacterium]|nr:histidine phosphatase family protein [Acidimicrobiales bacterium]
MPPSRLVVVRHGATAWSLSGRHTGRTDLPLEPPGEAQARGLAARLAGHRFAAVLVSPLRRARQTCDLAGFGDGAEVVPGLAEWDYGDYEGRTSAEIRAERPGWSLWRDGVPAGETIGDVCRRADEVVKLARGHGGDVLAFGSGHILRVVAARWLGLDPSFGGSLALGAGALGVLGWEHEEPALVRWNDDGEDPLST